MTRSIIDPITRIEGHLRVEMEVENGKVSDFHLDAQMAFDTGDRVDD